MSLKRLILLAALVMALPLFPSGPALALDTKYSSTLEELLGSLPPDAQVPVIVQTNGPPSNLLRTLVTTLGGVAGPSYTSINAFPARLSVTGILTLSLDMSVKRISRDWVVLSLADSAAPYSGAVDAWRDYGVSGRGIGVAVIDSGLADNPDVVTTTTRRVTRVNTMSTGLVSSLLSGPAPVDDRFGHGTHVAGIVGGSGASSTGSQARTTFKGVAYNADLISVRALADDGSGWTSDILRAIDWVVSNRAAYKIRVLNMSLGHPVDESYLLDPLCQAVEAAWRAGIVVVVAAGNFGEYGYSTILSPGNDPYVITVGAAADWNTLSYADDATASFSSMGPTAFDGFIKPDIIASGIQVVSTRAPGSWIDANYPMTRIPYSAFLKKGSNTPSPYAAYSGTSMASPVVAGAAALMLSKNPTLNPDTVKARLMAAAHLIPEAAIRIGAGLLDVRAAISRTDISRASMESKSAQVSSTTGADGSEVINILDPAHLFNSLTNPDAAGQMAIWGGRAQWGQMAIWGGRSNAQMAIWGGRAQSGPEILTATE